MFLLQSTFECLKCFTIMRLVTCVIVGLWAVSVLEEFPSARQKSYGELQIKKNI